VGKMQRSECQKALCILQEGKIFETCHVLFSHGSSQKRRFVCGHAARNLVRALGHVEVIMI
jgi:hypothetical protein